MRAANRLFPEIGAGGYSHVDGTVEFYSRVRALVQPSSTVLDLGAGRGRFLDDPIPYRREIRSLRGSVHRIIGVDIDPIVRSNPSLDEAHVVSSGDDLPLPDAIVDVLISDYTFEHVVDAGHFCDEIDRVLRPGGWLCARTPNKYGYVGLGARIVPDSLHVSMLRRLQPSKRPDDTFPVAYRLNSRKALRKRFVGYDDFSYTMNNEPAYFGQSRLGWYGADFVHRLLPRRLGSMLYVFMRKPPSGAGT